MAPGLMLNKLPLSPFRVMVAVVGVAAVLLVISALTAAGPENKLGHLFPHEQIKRDTVERTMADANFWRTVNLREAMPADVADNSKNVEVKTHNINIMGSDTFYREAVPPTGVASSGEVVLLLHGAAFKSETWLGLHTIHLLAAMGHRVVAIDLPGFGESKTSKRPSNNAEYLLSFMKELNIVKPIVVSPSMSGGFSIPLIVAQPDALGGFVPVAPVGTENLRGADSLKVPTLIIWGEKDRSLGVTSKENLGHIPTSQAVMIPNGHHPAYLDDPDLFHTLLYNFIKQVHAHKA